MNNTARKRTAVVVLSQVAVVLAVVVEWLAGSACVTPQVVREVQTAKPLKPGQTQVSVSGGMTDSIVETHPVGAFMANPNADFNVLIRHAREGNEEIQVPINLSTRLGPGSDDQFWGVHAATGLFFKRSHETSSGDFARYFAMDQEKLTPTDWQEKNYWARPLYKAWVFGPTAGVQLSPSYPYEWFASGRDESGYSFNPDGPLLVSPFVGFYFRYIHEKRKEGYIRLRGLLASVSYYPMDIPVVYEEMSEAGAGLPLGIETFVGVFIGSERSKHISSFTLGVGTSRITMPRLVIGFTFGSKGRLI